MLNKISEISDFYLKTYLHRAAPMSDLLPKLWRCFLQRDDPDKIIIIINYLLETIVHIDK